MQWYYASNGQQKGPVEDAEFAQLVRDGIIRSDTLVWRAGMPNWQPHGHLVAGSGVVEPPSPPVVPAGQPDHAAPEVEGAPVQLEFFGRAGEFFPIWIVNLLLTVVTFGIYAAWAKVRTRRYFYSNTRLLGHAFEYLGDPKKILIGNLIVIGVFFLYTMAVAISPLVQVPVLLLMMVAVPWFIVRALIFNARNSAWRGLRFRFHGRYGNAVVVFILLPMAVPFTLGLLLPYVIQRQRAFLVSQHAYGSTGFSFRGEVGEFYKIYGFALLFFLPVVAVYMTIFGMAIFGAIKSGGHGVPSSPGMAVIGLLILVAFPLAYVGTFYLRSRLFNYTWNNTMLGNHRFEAWMRARDLLWLQFSNSVVILFTLGLMYPWAAIRTVRFRLSCMQLVPVGNMDRFVAGSQVEVGALGEAASDFLDFDLGFGL